MDNWNNQIDEITRSFINQFGNLTSDQMNWKPDTHTWSIAQNMEHIMVVNESYFPTIQALNNGTYKAPFMTKFGFIASITGNGILRSVQPDRKRKMKTFSIWEPDDIPDQNDILKRFQDHQTELKRYIDISKNRIKSGTIIASPVNKNIVYNVDTAFNIIVAHEQRHLEQSRELFQMMNHNSGDS